MDREREKSFLQKCRLKIIIITTVLFGLVLYKFSRDIYTPIYKIKRSEIIISTVKKESITQYIQATGTVRSALSYSLNSPESGKVIKIHNKSGDRVEVGDIILELESDNLVLEKQQIEDQVTQKHHEFMLLKDEFSVSYIDYQDKLLDLDYSLEKLNKTLDKDRYLLEQGVISKQSYKILEDEINYWNGKRSLLLDKLDSFKLLQNSRESLFLSSINQLESKINQLDRRIDGLKIRSEYDGILKLKALDVGYNLSWNENIGSVESLNRYKISAFIDEFYLEKLFIGSKAKYNDSVLVTITSISPLVENGKILVEFNFDSKQPKQLKNGQTVNLKILSSTEEEKVVIEEGSYYTDSDGSWVFRVVDSDVEKVPITIGIKNREYIEILSGLDVGDRVITSSYKKYREYDKLKIEEI